MISLHRLKDLLLHASLLYNGVMTVEVVDRFLILLNEYEVISFPLLLFCLLVEDFERGISVSLVHPHHLTSCEALLLRLGLHHEIMMVDVDCAGRIPKSVLFLLFLLLRFSMTFLL